MKQWVKRLHINRGIWFLLASCFAIILVLVIFVPLRQSSLAIALDSHSQPKNNTMITPTLYLPIVEQPASDYICDNISIQLLPDQTTYLAETAVYIHIFGLKPEDGQVNLQWARTSANLQLADTWEDLETTWSQAGYYESIMQLPSMLTGPAPYNTSYNQEFFVAVTLQDNETGNLICAGNPTLDNTLSPTENPFCQQCIKMLVTRQDQSDTDIDLTPFWNIVPGYSFTYEGSRFDNPEDDLGNPVNGDFITRMTYEAPVSICETAVIPQQFTKNNRWGYWQPAAAKATDRNGSIWTEGNANLRFFVTISEYAYPWASGMMGAYFQKVYNLNGQPHQLGNVGNNLDRTIVNTSWQNENLYYPPYLLSYETVKSNSWHPFVRIDSIYHHRNMEAESEICKPQSHNSDHYWYTRTGLLTDLDLIDEFQTMANYFGETKEIMVLTFFEATEQNNGRPNFREDWYLMKDVGLVGIDQAHWNITDSATAEIYLNAPFLKQGTEAKPHIHLRADRAYVGQPLEVTPIAPSSNFPMTVPAGDCYTVAVDSNLPNPMPYDGHLEYDGTDPPSLWINAVDGEPLWAEDGHVVSCLPENFPAGEYRVRLRPHIDQASSVHESIISHDPMPWSSNDLWIIVP